MAPNHVRARAHAEWGPGCLLRPTGGGVLDVFFLRGGRRLVNVREVGLIFGAKVLNREASILDAAALADWNRASHNLYVVRLCPEVLTLRRFVDINPPQTTGQERCVYVGLTGHLPSERLDNHLGGYKASRIVRDYGLDLEPELFAHLNPLPYLVGEMMEVELAVHLRSLGYAVWQN